MLPDKKNYTLTEVLQIFELSDKNIPELKKQGTFEEMEQILKEFKKIFKSAYRKMALKYHPDHGGSDHDFRVINKLYNNIMNTKVIMNPPPRIFKTFTVHVRTWSNGSTTSSSWDNSTTNYY